ncbi:MAG: hypothetical protein J3T61_07705 [Candidatus Brocadiales bacterium]|nr:hypothetical protein [Candidatus Bathyanammoxibius sp.]
MPGGILIMEIEEMMGKNTWEEARPLLYRALRKLADNSPQVPIISTSGNPENELKAEKGSVIVFDRGTGKTYTKELGDIGGDQRRGWKEVQVS